LFSGVHFYSLSSLANKGQNNIAFAAIWQLGDPKAAVDLLIKSDRQAEATLLARTYAPRLASFG
jgi:coatomer subunit beta'